MKDRGNGLIFYCIIECSMIGLMIWSLILQSYYLPGTYSGCRGAKKWQVIDEDTNLFSYMTDYLCKNDSSCTQGAKCHDFVKAWILGIVTV
jgi:hypothetical protein